MKVELWSSNLYTIHIDNEKALKGNRKNKRHLLVQIEMSRNDGDVKASHNL